MHMLTNGPQESHKYQYLLHSLLQGRKIFSMATNRMTSSHSRSNSVPSVPHPLVTQFEEYLHRLKSGEGTSSPSSSSSIVSQKVNSLEDLHGCVDKLLQLPIIKQSLARECNEKWADELLEGSLRLLDICSTAKDALFESKENIQQLQSVFRRSICGETAFTVECGKYLASRKKAKKVIRKSLANLKGTENEFILSCTNKDNKALSMISILKQAEAVTLTTLESLLLFISASKEQPKQHRWSVMSKLRHTKRVACESEQSHTNEFEKVDAALQSLISHKPPPFENLHNYMENLGMCILNQEGRIEHLQRQLIKTRVSLLNIFNH